MPQEHTAQQNITQNFSNISNGFVYQITCRNTSQLGTNFSASSRHGFRSTLGQLTFSLASLRYIRQCFITSQSSGTFIAVPCSCYYRFWRHLFLFILRLLRLYSHTRARDSSVRFLDHTYVTPHSQDTDIHAPLRDSNPQSLHARGCRPMPQTARPLGSA